VQEDKEDVYKFVQDTRIVSTKIANRFFWYYHEGTDAATLFKPLKISRRKT
jgi:uncharacterized protein YcfL